VTPFACWTRFPFHASGGQAKMQDESAFAVVIRVDADYLFLGLNHGLPSTKSLSGTESKLILPAPPSNKCQG